MQIDPDIGPNVKQEVGRIAWIMGTVCLKQSAKLHSDKMNIRNWVHP